MKTAVYVPRDSSALSMGAESVARAIRTEAAKRGVEIDLIRNGSRGMAWLEPLVEVSTPKGRVAYGSVSAKDVPGLFEAGFLSGAAHSLNHSLNLGLSDEIPYFKN